MKNAIFLFLLTSLTLGNTVAYSQEVPLKEINPDILTRRWPAQWISCEGAPSKQYGIYYFRKTFDLDEIPANFIIHVSADNRYHLYVNGKSVSRGPARGDLQHWRFESVDIAGDLVKGKNVLAAVVWNFGDDAPNSQMTLRTGFILTGNSKNESVVNTGNTWKSIQDTSYETIDGFGESLHAYYVVGPGEKITGADHLWGWMNPDFNDSGWKPAHAIDFGQPRKFGTNGDWMLVPRTIPFMEEKDVRGGRIRESEGLAINDSFLQGGNPVTIPAHSEAAFLIDQGYLTKAYPQLMVSGGGNTEIKVSYAESLFNKDGSKGNRNDVEGKEFHGNYDIFIPDGNSHRTFSTLWFRTYRYIQVKINTKEDPLVLEDFYEKYTGYPLLMKASFTSSDERLEKIWDTGWRTARMCAGEIYYDCPYYEQMQYTGDTRIQALISLYDAGDDRLMKKAIELYDDSRIPEGLTQSRYPAYSMQIIPPFSLYWVDMVHDYWMNRDDPSFVKHYIPGIENVLGWFDRRVGKDGILGPLQWWNFVDWADEWAWSEERGVGGVPDGVAEGGSSILTLQFVYALQNASELESAFGSDYQSNRYRQLAENLKKNVLARCWDANKGLLADTPDKKSFSQHANIFGVLTGTISEDRSREVLNKVLTDKSLIQCTLYFRFYLAQALKKAGIGNEYLDILGPWFTMLDNGLSTFAEKPDPTRSDCHAWSASPNYDFLTTVCGIEPASPGFKTVSLNPNPGNLSSVEGSMPHPLGMIHVKYRITGNKLEAEVDLPAGLTGTITWKGKTENLKEGNRKLTME